MTINLQTGTGTPRPATSPEIANLRSDLDVHSVAESNAYADAKVQNSMVASATIAPSADAVADAIADAVTAIGAGDVTGPTASTDGEMVVFNGATGKAVKRSNTLTGFMQIAGGVVSTLTAAALKAALTLVKGDVGLSNVDNTSDASKPVSSAQQAAIDAKVQNSMTASTTVAPSATAVNSAIATAVTGLLDLKGATDCSTNPNYPAASKGDVYIVSVAGKIGGASGKSVDIGDQYLAVVDNAGGTEASVGTSWSVFEHNLGGVLLIANNLSDVASAATARANLGALAAASPSSTGPVTQAGPSILTSYTITITTNAGVIDVTKPMGIASNAANTSLSFSGTPATDTWFGFEANNTDGANPRTWTIPSCWSEAQQGSITTFILPPNGRATMWVFRNASSYAIFGEPLGERDMAEETLVSAGTTSLGSTLSKNVSVTGTTTATSFGTAAAGVYRRVRPTGVWPITAGSAILMPGVASGQTINMAPGDRFDALSLGSGNWVVLNVSRVTGSRLLLGPTISASRALTAADFTDQAPSLFPVDTSSAAVVLTLNTSVIAPLQRAFFQRRGANTLTVVAGTGTISDPNTIGAGALTNNDVICVLGDPLTANKAILA